MDLTGDPTRGIARQKQDRCRYIFGSPKALGMDAIDEMLLALSAIAFPFPDARWIGEYDPGATAFTVTPAGVNSQESCLVRPTRACLAAVYA